MQNCSGNHSLKMKSTYILSFSSILTLAVLSFCFCGSKAVKNESRSMNDKGFAVVELFTSEGCSSCPPADEAIIKLAKEFPDHVYFLGYHVDYWDYIGWKDEFDNAEYTKRQNKYAEVFKLNSIYTPQAIINGEKELVGSRENELRAVIQEKLKTGLSSTIELNVKMNDSNNITVSYKVANVGRAALNMALVQRMAATNVKRGENNGRKLNHINIVRNFQTISLNKKTDSKTEFKIPAGLASKDMKVIAFVQNENNMKIIGATEASIQ
jgi:hypothetical protein